MSFENKYLKYKEKYLNKQYLNKQYGGIGAVAQNSTTKKNGSSSGPKSSSRGIISRTDKEQYIFEIKNMLTCFCMLEDTYIYVLKLIYPIVDISTEPAVEPTCDISANHIYIDKIKELNQKENVIDSKNLIIINKNIIF